jgi:hypothetical protein
MRSTCKFLLSILLLTLSSFAQIQPGRRDTLKGIGEIVIVVSPLWEAKWTAEAPGHTMDEKAIQAEMESALTAAGFKIVPRTTAKSVALILTVMVYPAAGYGTSDSVVYTKLAVKEQTNPVRDPTMTVTSETWSLHCVAPTREDLQGQVSNFTETALRGFVEGTKIGI